MSIAVETKMVYREMLVPLVFMISKPSLEMFESIRSCLIRSLTKISFTSLGVLHFSTGKTQGRAYRSLQLIIFLTLGEALAMGLVFGLPQNTIGTNEPFPGNLICADADPLDGSHWVVYYWTAILVIESILLSLAVYKAWQHRASVRGSTLMQALTRDSVVYFATILWIYIANLIIWYYNRITINEIGTAPAFVISSIFANRLLISVRTTHYRDITDVGTYMPSVRFIKRDPGFSDNSRTLNNTIELTTFNETAGV
ncbi:hypothetical protein DXG01_001986 [Tephrocybe rancida]|nr:hypothetical protein DXG01_001986 [Tephrocybe rancida]